MYKQIQSGLVPCSSIGNHLGSYGSLYPLHIFFGLGDFCMGVMYVPPLFRILFYIMFSDLIYLGSSGSLYPLLSTTNGFRSTLYAWLSWYKILVLVSYTIYFRLSSPHCTPGSPGTKYKFCIFMKASIVYCT